MRRAGHAAQTVRKEGEGGGEERVGEARKKKQDVCRLLVRLVRRAKSHKSFQLLPIQEIYLNVSQA
jgi:hypothetical protein